jgi:hypothetical protein
MPYTSTTRVLTTSELQAAASTCCRLYSTLLQLVASASILRLRAETIKAGRITSLQHRTPAHSVTPSPPRQSVRRRIFVLLFVTASTLCRACVYVCVCVCVCVCLCLCLCLCPCLMRERSEAISTLSPAHPPRKSGA